MQALNLGGAHNPKFHERHKRPEAKSDVYRAHRGEDHGGELFRLRLREK
jgi:hypothetical protein